VRPLNGLEAAVGIDLGGTKTNADGTVLLRERTQTPRDDGYDAMLTTVAKLIDHAAVRLGPKAPYTVGIGIPGSLDEKTGLVRNANSTRLIG